MKKIILPLFVFITYGLYAQTSTELGDPNEFKQFIPEKASFNNYSPMAFNKKQELYIAYTVCSGACNFLEPWGTLHVQKKTGNSWQEIGNLSSIGKNKAYPFITFDQFDTAYIAFFDGIQITVMKYNGSGWINVGNAGFGGDLTRNNVISLVFDYNNTPYVSTAAEVYKLNGNSWTLIHSNTGLENEYFTYSITAPISDTCIYLPARTKYPGNKLSILRYSPGLNYWDTLGQSNVDTTVNFSYVEVKADSKNNFYFVTHDSGSDTYLFSLTGNNWTKKIQIPNSYGLSRICIDKYDSVYVKAVIQIVQYAEYRPKIYKYTGSGISLVGNNPMTPYLVSDGSFCLDSNGTPYFFYEYDNSAKLNISRLENDTQWTTITGAVSGNLGINGRVVTTPLITVNPKTGLPFMMYTEPSSSASISFWNSAIGKWTPVGSEGFTGPTYSYSIAFDTTGKSFCVFSDLNGILTAKEFNGSSWVNTGSPDITSGAATGFNSMSVSKSGTPYVAFSVYDGVKSKAQVKKYTGTWQTVGSTSLSLGNASHTRIVVSESGTPFIIFSDDSLGGQAVVKKFDGTNWINVGGPSLGAEKAIFTSIAIDAHDTAYALFTNPDNGRMVVKKNIGSLWEPVGSQFNDSIEGGGSVGLDLAGFPYVTYPDPAHEHKASIKWFNGTAWNYLGTPGFSAGRATKPVITFDKNNNLYVAYTTGQAFARKFSNLVTGVHTATITRTRLNNLYPNPVSSGGVLHIDIQPQDIGKTYSIYDLQGKIKYRGKLLFENNELNPDLFTKGIYLLRIEGSANTYKLVVQE